MKNFESYDFDVIIVGGGHAGVEAAYSAARLGSKTLLLTLDIKKIGAMSCNPAIGGVGKGHIVFEISALGGLMPKLCTQTYLQARMLNTKKGPAVQGLRLQIDRHAYNKLAYETLSQTDNLTLSDGKVEKLLLRDNDSVCGVKAVDGTVYYAQSVVLTTGTFLNGLIHIGKDNFSAGRAGEEAVANLSEFLMSLGIKMGRLKTGTPPRLSKDTIDFAKLERQDADNLNYLFEFYPHKVSNKRDCYIAHTNQKTHDIIKNNLHLSPMFNGQRDTLGPRYCPSIEDKISRFPHKTSHHVFVEPESLSTDEIYPNGISTSLPLEIQKKFINSIVGFEEAVIKRPGYAVEYDFVYPNQLTHALEVKKISGLFLAGQINGTTGYEEAAGQGIIAGINAHRKINNEKPFTLDRSDAYIGIMIDDLVTLGVDEPYRMFTSRAERRLILRQDNVFLRLAKTSHNLGLIDEKLYHDIRQEKKIITETMNQLRSGNNNQDLMQLLGNQESNKQKLIEMTGGNLTERTINTVWADIRYEPYLKREQKEIEKAKQYAELKIPETFDYSVIPGLSKELQQKLAKFKPATIAQANLISGMTPAAISLLIFKTREQLKEKKS